MIGNWIGVCVNHSHPDYKNSLVWLVSSLHEKHVNLNWFDVLNNSQFLVDDFDEIDLATGDQYQFIIFEWFNKLNAYTTYLGLVIKI